MRKIKKFPKTYLILYFLIFIIISSKTDFFLNFYKILKQDHYSRLQSYYGYCYPMGFGFINKMKKKYNLEHKNLNSVNKEIFPSSLIFSFNISQKKTNKEILINYSKVDLIDISKDFKILEKEGQCYLIEYKND